MSSAGVAVNADVQQEWMEGLAPVSGEGEAMDAEMERVQQASADPLPMGAGRDADGKPIWQNEARENACYY